MTRTRRFRFPTDYCLLSTVYCFTPRARAALFEDFPSFLCARVDAVGVEGGVYYVIGPEKQLAAYEQYLKTVEGADAKLYRIYPRDYWIRPADAADVGGRPGTN